MFTSPNWASFTIDRLVQRFKWEDRIHENGKEYSHIRSLGALMCDNDAIRCWLVCDKVYPMGLVVAKEVKVKKPAQKGVTPPSVTIMDRSQECFEILIKKHTSTCGEYLDSWCRLAWWTALPTHYCWRSAISNSTKLGRLNQCRVYSGIRHRRSCLWGCPARRP